MTRTATIDRLPKELAYRSNDGIEVWLLWTKADNRLFILLVDSRTGDMFEIDVESHDALYAFDHPYGYAAWRGIEYVAPLRQTESAVA
jgi:hypothetical protein